MKTREAIFISGLGSNLKAVLDHFPTRDFFVYSNKNAKGLSWAKRRGLSTEIKTLKQNEDWTDFAEELNDLKIKRVFLLGFMKIIPAVFLEKFKGEMINLHPSLLPSFPGLNSIKRAYEENAPVGVSLHEVTEGVDEGPIFVQKAISRLQSDGFKEVEAKTHFLEQFLMRRFLRALR